jgi:hypothetical protein
MFVNFWSENMFVNFWSEGAGADILVLVCGAV